jgi:Tol biopolymer transport system component
LQGTEGASFPFWSPDSRSIAFFAYGQLKRIDATGGSTQVLCAASESRGGSWGADGAIIFAPTITSGIFRVPDTGGTPVQISKLDASRHENSHRWPSFLPDGKHFLYLARTAALTDSAIRVGAIDGSESRVVVTATGNPAYARSGYLLYPQGSKLLAQKFDPASLSVSGDPVTILENVANNGNVQHASYSISQNGMLLYHRGVGSGHSSLKILDRSGKLLRVIDDSAAFFGPTLSPDATRIAVSATSDQNSSATDLWIYDLKTLAKTRFTFSSPSSADSSRLPVWSPDGSQLAFSSFRDGHYQIFVKSSNGVGPETAVYPGEGQRYAMSWSPDGHYLLVYEEGSQFNQGRMMVVPITGGDEKPFPIRPELTTLTLFCMPRISPDGKWLTYMSNESGRAEVYLTTFPKGEGKWQVSTQGAVQPGWSRDGKELFFVNTQFRLQSVSIESRGDSPVFQNVRDLFWAPLVLSASWTYDSFPGGQSFLLNAVVNPLVSEPISLVENWEGSLSRK